MVAAKQELEPDSYEVRPIPGIEGYSVDSEGVVYTHWRSRGRPGQPKGSGFEYYVDAAYLHPVRVELDKWHYPRVRLVLERGKKPTWRRVNRLVCLAFYGPAPTAEHDSAHENGIRGDCRAVNLAWKTKLENADDRRRHGTHDAGAAAVRIFTETDLADIELMDREGMSRKVIAATLGVSFGAINDFLAGRTYKKFRTSGEAGRVFGNVGME